MRPVSTCDACGCFYPVAMDLSVAVSGITAAAFLGEFAFKMFEPVGGGMSHHQRPAPVDSLPRTCRAERSFLRSHP